LVGASEGKKAVRRPMLRPDDNIKMDIIELRWESVDCIQLLRICDL
jgi:hypothetical protein